MLTNLLQELTWNEFTKLPGMQGKTLNEQVAYYKQYLSDLEQARHSLINYQNKGRTLQPAVPSGSPSSCTAGMDVVFLIDYTSSMSNEIDDLKLDIANIVNTIIAESGGDYRLGLVIFDEWPLSNPPSYSTQSGYATVPLQQRYVNQNPSATAISPTGVTQYITALEVMSTQNSSSFTTKLNLLNTANFSMGAGVGGPEPGGVGFEQILNGIAGSFRQNVAKLVILITDNQPGGDDDVYDPAVDIPYLQTVAAQGLQENVQVLVLSQMQVAAGTNYRVLTEGTNGLFVYSSTFDPANIITLIEDLCDANA